MRVSPSYGGLFAVLSGLIWLTLTPLMATVGICDGACSRWDDKPVVVRIAGPFLADHGLLSFAPSDALYFTYGRFFFLVYLCAAIALAGLHRALLGGARGDRLARVGYRALQCSLLTAALGDFLSYGVGAVSATAWRYGFGLEGVAWAGIVLGSILYGLAMARTRRMPLWTAVLLVAGAVLLPVMFLDRYLVMYWPNAQLLPFCAAWTAVGAYLLTRVRRMGQAASTQVTQGQG